MAKSARMFQWLVITLFLLIGTGGYFWYRSRAGVTLNTSQTTSLTNGLVGYWTFDGADMTATQALDKSGNSNAGTLTGTTKAIGKLGQALSFNGSSDVVDIGVNGFSSGTNPRTISAWVKLNALDNGYHTIIGYGNQAGSEYFQLFYNGFSGDVWSVISWDPNAGVGSSETAVANVWTHLVATYSGGNASIYVNGVLSGGPTALTSNLVMAGGVIGGTSGYGYFPGSIDETRVYNRALSASEIYQLYTSGNAKINAPSEDPLSQSLRGYWKLDDGSGTNATDSSGNGNTLAMTGSPSWTTGNIGPYALDFSGSGQYLSVASPSSGILDFADGEDFSISGWFNRDTFTADHTIVAKKTNQTTNAGYVVWIDNNGSTDYLSAEISDGTDTYSAIGTTNLSSTGWHQFSIVWDDSNGLYIYLDGKLDGSTTSSTASINSLANANAFRIGAESDAGVPFDGKIDDIRVYNYALSADQVKKIYNAISPIQPIDTSLAGHWTFDGTDIQGTMAIDRSSFGNNGTITGAVPAIGKLGQGIRFDNTSSKMDVSSIASTTQTVCAWVNAVSYPSGVDPDWTDAIAFKGNDNLNGYFGISVGNAIARSASSGKVFADYPGGYTLNEWFHICGVLDGPNNSLRAYYNGSPGTSVTVTGFSTNTEAWTIGYHNNVSNPYYFDGVLDDVRIYNRALSSTEVLNLYNMGK